MHLDSLPGTFFGPSNLVELLLHRARCQPTDIAFTYLVDGENEEVHLTYQELDHQARAIGAWLESHDLVGQRALLLYPAGLEFIAAFFGCLYAGVIAVPVYPPRRNRSLGRIQAIADDAEARVALTTDSVLNRVMPLIDQTPHLKQLTWLPTCRVSAETARDWTMPDVHGDTLAFLQYTSGSTGAPKGVVLSHASLVHNSALISYSFEHTRTGRGVFWLPSYHDMGLIGGILQPLYIGRPNVLISPMSFLQKPYRWLSAITRYRGSTSGGPNFAYDLCVRKITPEQRKTLDLSSWQVAFNGAEPVRAETLDAFAETFAPCGFRREAFYPCYGLAEATLIVSGGYVHEQSEISTFDAEALARNEVVSAEPDAPGGRKLVGCGKNLPDQRIEIVDPETRVPCPAGRIGEIWVQGPSVAQGYWGQEEATEQVFRARLADTGEGNFLRTGDLGFMEDGELYVAGRLKDLLIVHGVNYYPQDIERTVQQSHPRLRLDCGAAFVVEKNGREQLVVTQEIGHHKQSNFQEVFDAIRRTVAGEHELIPSAIVLLKAGSIPKTSSGKIQRHACRDGYLAGTLKVVGQWRDEERGLGTSVPSETIKRKSTSPKPSAEKPQHKTPAEQPAPVQGIPAGHRLTDLVVEEIRRVAKGRANGMTLDSPIVETGMDSLERMEILASLEDKFGGRFPEEVLPEMETARQLVTAVEKYLGIEPRPASVRPADAEIPAAAYCFDQFPEYVSLRENLDMLEASGLGNPFFMVHDGPARDTTIIGGKKYIHFSSYNYLGMSGNPAVNEAAKAATDRYGTSASASRVVSGQKVIHVELEREITRFMGTEDTVAFVGGHATNESVIGHLFGPGDLILHDSLAHNSIVQGCILSGARRRPFLHNDWQAADNLLKQYRHEYRRVLLAIEGVYSMDGDVSDLPKFVEVKKRHKALLMIDEAHSLGILGATGRGIGEHFGVAADDVDIWMGTFSKSLGSCGGYISGCKALTDYLRYTAPGFVFAAAVPPASAAAVLAALRLLQAEPQQVARLRENARLFLGLAKQHGLNTGASKDSPIVPVILGNSIHCLQLSKAMFSRGVNVQPIVHPAVEENAARLRYFITAMHTEEQLRYTIQAMVEELERIGADRPAPVATEGE
ncbi:MAG: aminotransferase class I/II-fold pyridoxal phosphate-dependent enzyme [Planctomycetales bacterium]|nr:aminotransferase class I/II-fold pyridoxal phosphate-dependent enzyme [Planctomycetales bacterium]